MNTLTSKCGRKWSSELNNLQGAGARRVLTAALVKGSRIDGGFMDSKLLFCPAAARPFEQRWLKRRSAFITRGQSNYLEDAVTKKSMWHKPFGRSQSVRVRLERKQWIMGLTGLCLWFTAGPAAPLEPSRWLTRERKVMNEVLTATVWSAQSHTPSWWHHLQGHHSLGQS